MTKWLLRRFVIFVLVKFYREGGALKIKKLREKESLRLIIGLFYELSDGPLCCFEPEDSRIKYMLRISSFPY